MTASMKGEDGRIRADAEGERQQRHDGQPGLRSMARMP